MGAVEGAHPTEHMRRTVLRIGSRVEGLAQCARHSGWLLRFREPAVGSSQRSSERERHRLSLVLHGDSTGFDRLRRQLHAHRRTPRGEYPHRMNVGLELAQAATGTPQSNAAFLFRNPASTDSVARAGPSTGHLTNSCHVIRPSDMGVNKTGADNIASDLRRASTGRGVYLRGSSQTSFKCRSTDRNPTRSPASQALVRPSHSLFASVCFGLSISLSRSRPGPPVIAVTHNVATSCDGPGRPSTQLGLPATDPPSLRSERPSTGPGRYSGAPRESRIRCSTTRSGARHLVAARFRCTVAAGTLRPTTDAGTGDATLPAARNEVIGRAQLLVGTSGMRLTQTN